MITIANDGTRIASTNYWQTEHAAKGLVYLSVNAGAVRLLVPRGWPDLDNPRVVRVTLQIIGAPAVGVAHILLEDGSHDPGYLTIDARQCDRAMPAADAGRELPLLVYGPGDDATGVRLVRKLPARIEHAAREPR